MGSNSGKAEGLCSVVTEAVKGVATIPVWCKLTPATRDMVVEAAACFRGGADAIVSSNTFPSLPVIEASSSGSIRLSGVASSTSLNN
jgi:dihydroorotate dehydrogenase